VFDLTDFNRPLTGKSESLGQILNWGESCGNMGKKAIGALFRIKLLKPDYMAGCIQLANS
jgi:hypothetical protein